MLRYFELNNQPPFYLKTVDEHDYCECKKLKISVQ